MKLLFPSAGLLLLLGACTAVPQERMTTGAGMGAASGCGMAALATVWTGLGAGMACVVGGGMGALMGADLGLLTTPPPPAQ